MSDRDNAPDPVDEAYVRAEAILGDGGAEADARAARRARVLAAVAREAAAPPAAASPPLRGWVGRQGRWLAAAGVAGLGLIVAIQLYQPAPRQLQTAPPAPAVPAPVASSVVAAPTQAVPAPSPAEASRTRPTAPRPATPAQTPSPSDVFRAAPSPPALATAPPPRAAFPLPPPPPPLYIAPVARPVVPAPPPPANFAGSLAGAARDEPADGRDVAPSAGMPAARSAFPAETAVARPGRPEVAARLRAAAAAGRTDEVEALLAQGVPLDAPDADGETALMKSVQADHPNAAALLRRHGASLDRRNRAGESARDMAAAMADKALDRALGLGP